MGSEWLYLAQFAVASLGKREEYRQAEIEAEEGRQAAAQQVATAKKLGYNAHLGLNSEHMLEMVKFGFGKFEIDKSIRSKRAKIEAIAASFGGTFGQQGGSFNATLDNISRHGGLAMARKDKNFKNLAADFNRRHTNVDLETESKVNAALSGLSTGGSVFGTGLSILSTGLQTKLDYDKGTKRTQARQEKE